MVRLRKVLERIGESLVPLSRPYRLPARLELDAHRVLAFLDRGAYRVALGAYSGALLATSVAPGIAAIRQELSQRLRDALLTDSSGLLTLPPKRSSPMPAPMKQRMTLTSGGPVFGCFRPSPRSAAVVARLERIEAVLGLQQVAASPQPRRP